MRLIRHMCNENMQSVNNVWVTIERKASVAHLIINTAQYFDTVEYIDGSFLDVYYDGSNGFVGIEYDANCRFVS